MASPPPSNSHYAQPQKITGPMTLGRSKVAANGATLGTIECELWLR